MRTTLFAIVLVVLSSSEISGQDLFKVQKQMIGNSIETIEFTDYIKNISADNQLNTQFKVMEFWASWCQPCLKVLPHLNKLNSKFKDKNNLLFLSITYEAPEQIQKTLEKFNFETAVVSDQNKTIHQALKIEHEGFMILPVTVLVDDNNKVIWYGSPHRLNERILHRFINRERL